MIWNKSGEKAERDRTAMLAVQFISIVCTYISLLKLLGGGGRARIAER